MRAWSYYILFVGLFLLAGCEQQDRNESFSNNGTVIRLMPVPNYTTRIVDEDNPVSEQVVKNVSLFLTEPSSQAILYKYVYIGFSYSEDNGTVNLPLEPSELAFKDIYMIVNYDSRDKLEALETLDDIGRLITPEVDKTNNLDPANGFCMYGFLLDFDFANQEGEVAVVELERTCAKLRVKLRFPQSPGLSIDNSFLIQRAARYTFVIDNPATVLPQSDYFNFAAPEVLVENEGVYTNVVYVYEANQPPVITLYTHLNNSTEQQEYTADLPIPERNYLYDLLIEVYEDDEPDTRSFVPESALNYYFTSSLKVYNGKGEIIEDFIP